MTAIEARANRVCTLMYGGEVKAFDPILVMTIANILYQLVKMYRECGASEEEAAKKAANPGIIGRWRMGRIIQAKLKGTPYEGEYHAVKDAILETSQEMTVSDFSIFFRETRT